jgi:hypothetical protein
MSTFDPAIDLARMEQAFTQTAPATQLYPGWYEPEHYKRPDPIALHAEGIRLYELYAFQRAALRVDQELLRMMRQGIFDNDHDLLDEGIIEDFLSTSLVDDYHLAVSIISGIDPFFPIEGRDDHLQTYYRQKRAAADWLYHAEARAHTRSGEIPTNILQTKLLLERGALVKRRTLNRYARTGESPFITKFIDPVEVIPIWEGYKGLGRVYRIFSMTVRDVCAEFPDVDRSQLKKIGDLIGKDLTVETAHCDIVEYWDRRWRCTTMAGAVLIPPTEHNYGEPPYTIGYGPLSEPHVLKLPDASQHAPETAQQQLQYKMRSFIWSKKHPHLFNEAMMKRYVLAFQRLLYPAMTTSVDPMFKGDLPPYDNTPAANNREIKGVAEYKGAPPSGGGIEAQVLMAQLNSQVQTGFAPPTAYGYMPDQANISGTANRASLSAGLHLHRPWISSLQSFIAEDLSKAMRMIRNFGSVVEYGEVGQYKPIMAPVSRPAKGDPAITRLNRQLLDATGTDVTVRMTIRDKDSWMQMAQTATILKQAGVPFQYLAEELFGMPYDDQMREEWREEMAEEAMYRHPKFMELAVIPQAIEAMVQEAEGDEMRARDLLELKERWEALVVQPGMAQHDAQLAQNQQAMQPPPPMGNMNPPTTEGVSLPDLGQGPGSVTGNQGGRPPAGVM